MPSPATFLYQLQPVLVLPTRLAECYYQIGETVLPSQLRLTTTGTGNTCPWATDCQAGGIPLSPLRMPKGLRYCVLRLHARSLSLCKSRGEERVGCTGRREDSGKQESVKEAVFLYWCENGRLEMLEKNKQEKNMRPGGRQKPLQVRQRLRL